MKLSKKDIAKLADNHRLLRDILGDALFAKMLHKENIEKAMDTLNKAMDLAA